MNIFFAEVSKLGMSRNGLQALRERSGAGDGVARGGAPHKTKSLFMEFSKQGTKRNPGSEGAERCWVRCGAGRGATQNKLHFCRSLEAAPFEGFRGSFY